MLGVILFVWVHRIYFNKVKCCHWYPLLKIIILTHGT
jgi:hypothetical protein